MGGTGLERLAVVHHALHGVGLLSAVELLLLGLAAADVLPATDRGSPTGYL